MHIHIHQGHELKHRHPHGNLVSRVTQDLDTVLDWLTGPGMTERQRSARNSAEARNERYGNGVM